MEKLIILVVTCTLILAGWFIFRDYHGELSYGEGPDCRRYCEWQMSQMTETFNTLKVQMNETCKTLIDAYEDKLRKLHGSDMDMTLMRQQWHKEFIEQIKYEFQSFQRYYTSKFDESRSSQFCTGYCSSLEKQLRHCKENATFLWSNHVHIIKHREQRLRYHLRDSRERIQSAGATATTSRRLAIIALLLLIVSTLFMVCLGFYYHHKLYVCAVTLEKMKEQAKKREYQINQLTKNIDRFWQERFSKVKEDETKLKLERDERQRYIHSLESQVSSLKMHELKQKGQLTSEILACHNKMSEMERELELKSHDSTAEQQLMLAETVEEQDEIIRDLEQELKTLEITFTTEREKSEVAHSFEKERTLQRISRLEQHNTALTVEASRLEEALKAKDSKSSKRKRGSPRVDVKNQECQTMDCSESEIDSRLADMHREIENRFDDLQEKVKKDRAKEIEEVKLLKNEQEELRTKLEVANKRCTYLEDLLRKHPPESQILMCNVEKLKLPKRVHGSSQREFNLISGLQKLDVQFLTPPFDFGYDDSASSYLSIQ